MGFVFRSASMMTSTSAPFFSTTSLPLSVNNRFSMRISLNKDRSGKPGNVRVYQIDPIADARAML